jgi:hypothetical protein
MKPHRELLVIERDGMRLALPAERIRSVATLLDGRGARLQERFGQAPPTPGERCVALTVDTRGGDAMVPVAGTVSMMTVAAADVAALPALFARSRPVAAVVFAGEASLLVLDADAAAAIGAES